MGFLTQKDSIRGDQHLVGRSSSARSSGHDVAEADLSIAAFCKKPLTVYSLFLLGGDRLFFLSCSVGFMKMSRLFIQYGFFIELWYTDKGCDLMLALVNERGVIRRYSFYPEIDLEIL